MSQREHISVVFATIFPDNLAAFRHAQQILTKEHFEGNKHAGLLWNELVKYSQKYGGIPTPVWLKDKFKKLTNHTARNDFVILEDMVERFTTEPASSLSAFKASVDALHDEYIDRRTGGALSTACEIIIHGAVVDGEGLAGHEAAREYVTTAIRAIEAEYHVGDISEGDVSKDSDFLTEYEKVKQARLEGGDGGIGFGISSVDEHVGGVMPGDLVLVGGFTGHGKTQILSQMAWHAMVNQKKNVFFSTTETVRRQVHSRILARHSRLEKFGVRGGLNSKHILKSSLSTEHEKVMLAVYEDLTTGDYGSIFISQTPSDATLDFVESRLVAQEQHSHTKYDLLLLDSLYLLRAPRKRASEREEFNDLLREAKRKATALGIPIVTPWQITREAWKKAEEELRYNRASLSDTSEAEKSASLIVMWLKDPNGENIGYMQVMKNRDGEEMDSRVLSIDFRNAYLADSAEVEYSSASTGIDTRHDLLGAF